MAAVAVVRQILRVTLEKGAPAAVVQGGVAPLALVGLLAAAVAAVAEVLPREAMVVLAS